MLAIAVYTLCLLTSASCMAVLAREYKKNRVRLLLWMSLCFLGLALSNFVLILDKFVIQDISLATFRVIPAAAGFGVLIFGLIWDTV